MIMKRLAVMSSLGRWLFRSLVVVFFGKEGLFRGKERDYLEAGSIEAMKVPEGMESKPIEPLYVIPESRAQDEFGDDIDLTEFQVPRPLGN